MNAYVLNRKISVWAAAEKGDFYGVKAAVENGEDIEERGGWFPTGTGLHHACYKGHFSTADYLIQRGAKVNSRNKHGSLPIHYACIHGHLDTVKLVSKGNNFTSTNDYRRTPLHFASLNGHTSVAKYLIQCGAELNSIDKDGYMPMHLACIHGQLDTVVLLNSKGSDFTSKNNDGHTPYHLALVNRHTSIADYLMQCGGEGN